MISTARMPTEGLAMRDSDLVLEGWEKEPALYVT